MGTLFTIGNRKAVNRVIRTALDSDVPDIIPDATDFVFTYSDLITDPIAYQRQFKRARVVYIDRGLGDPQGKSSIIDIETGARTVADLPAWYEQQSKLGRAWLTAYCNRSNLGAVIASPVGNRLHKWVATLDGTLAIDGFTPLVGPDLVQVLPADKIGIHADFSLILNPFWRPTTLTHDATLALDEVRATLNQISAATGNLHAVEAFVGMLAG